MTMRQAPVQCWRVTRRAGEFDALGGGAVGRAMGEDKMRRKSDAVGAGVLGRGDRRGQDALMVLRNFYGMKCCWVEAALLWAT